MTRDKTGTRKVYRERSRRNLGDVVVPLRPVAKDYGVQSTFVDRATLPITPRQRQILDALPATTGELRDRCGVSWNAAYSALRYLAAKDLARQRDGRWEASDAS